VVTKPAKEVLAMTNKPIRKSAGNSHTIYQITVHGSLREDWREWFNGMLIASDSISNGGSSTTFTCKVRDQSELIGIINWLHQRNMVIEEVSMFRSEMENKDV
jgi:hypothetical protein